MLRQPSEEFRLECPDCATRHGVGYYAQTGASFALDRRQYFRLGLTGRVYRGRTDGMRLGLAPPFETRDHWVSVFGEFTVNF